MTENRKVVLVGPVYPYRSGIAQYTGLLAKALAKQYQLRTISYKMQYPSFMFKGPQKDYANDSFKVENAEFLINTANPFNIAKVALSINKSQPDLVIMEWWHPYFAPCDIILRSLIKAPVLFLCHNVFPHERFPLDRFLTRLVLKKGDYFVLHSEKEADALKSIVPQAPYRINMHPTYDIFDHGQVSPVDSGSEKRLLFFGFVREYKGLRYLLQALKKLPDVKLVVSGEFGGSRAEYDELISSLGVGDQVEIHDEFTPDHEVAEYFVNCDAVVLPYIDATQSGIAQIAFGFKKPVIATRVGGLPEVVTDGVTGMLCQPADADSLADKIGEFYKLKDQVDFAANIEKDSERFSWEHMVKTIDSLVWGN